MFQPPHPRIVVGLTLTLGLLILISSLAGLLFEEELYGKNGPYYTPQIVGQDIANVALLVPTLALSALTMRRNSQRAFLIWLGTVMYTFYVFTAYGFTLHYNRTFLAYCGAFGISFYLLILALTSTDPQSVKDGFTPKANTKAPVILLLVVGIGISTAWLSEPIPAIFTGEQPEIVAMNDHVTSPFHLLDLGLLLPGLFVAAFLLHKEQPFGYVLAPALLTLMTITSTVLVEQGVVLALRGFELEWDSIALFGSTAITSALVLIGFLKRCTDSAATSP